MPWTTRTQLKLPNTVQLVESELPLAEAENADSLIGMFLFRQARALLSTSCVPPVVALPLWAKTHNCQ
ncbi:hypothetical protein HPB48_013974 [Haemaphysalis longicornis]|uniref:Uncharacterized protein n=1 Tax=Haemaphysalis longicornis TaxID=44386 RepID=A0A9J6G731_HAELO|nr:hypothetical protein HPB48_013974 [Haemaphysalis longicornis]